MKNGLEKFQGDIEIGYCLRQNNIKKKKKRMR